VVLSAEGTMRLENVDVEVIVVVLWEKGDDFGNSVTMRNAESECFVSG
jgi:hypothetical protein